MSRCGHLISKRYPSLQNINVKRVFDSINMIKSRQGLTSCHSSVSFTMMTDGEW